MHIARPYLQYFKKPPLTITTTFSLITKKYQKHTMPYKLTLSELFEIYQLNNFYNFSFINSYFFKNSIKNVSHKNIKMMLLRMTKMAKLQYYALITSNKLIRVHFYERGQKQINICIIQHKFIRMNRDTKGLAINTQFFEDNLQQKNSVISHSRNNSGNQQVFASIVALQNLFKTLFLKQLFTGWIHIYQRSKQKSYNRPLACLRKVQKQLHDQTGDQLKQRYSPVINGKNCEYLKSYQKYRTQKTKEDNRIKTQYNLERQQRVESNKQNLDFIASKNHKKDESQIGNQAKMNLRINKLQKMMIKIKRQHEQMKCGKQIYYYYSKSSRDDQRNNEITHYKKQIELLRKELEKVKIENSKLAQSIGFMGQTNNTWNNQPQKGQNYSQQFLQTSPRSKIFHSVKQYKHINKKNSLSSEQTKLATPLKKLQHSNHIPSFITKKQPHFNNFLKKQEIQTRISDLNQTNDSNTREGLIREQKINLNNIRKFSQQQNQIKIKHQNPQSCNQIKSQKSHILKMIKFKNSKDELNLANIKICRTQCKYSCHNDC